MKHTSWKYLVMAGAAIVLGACKDNTSPSIVTDTQVANDVAASAADAAANAATDLGLNEAAAALPSAQPSFDVFAGSPSETVTYTRTRVCLNGSNAVVSCSPLTGVVKIITTFTVDGSRTGVYFTGATHRSAVDTLTRVPGSSGDSLRVHSGTGTAHDTTTFTDSTVSATATEAAVDSINAVTFRIPRSSNPYPISGSIVRNVAFNGTYTRGSTTITKSVTKRVEVDFNGTVTAVLKFDAKTCDLNLQTHAVANCH